MDLATIVLNRYEDFQRKYGSEPPQQQHNSHHNNPTSPSTGFQREFSTSTPYGNDTHVQSATVLDDPKPLPSVASIDTLDEPSSGSESEEEVDIPDMSSIMSGLSVKKPALMAEQTLPQKVPTRPPLLTNANSMP